MTAGISCIGGFPLLLEFPVELAWFLDLVCVAEFLLAGENFMPEMFLFLELTPDKIFGLPLLGRFLASVLGFLLRGGTSLSEFSCCTLSSST